MNYKLSPTLQNLSILALLAMIHFGCQREKMSNSLTENAITNQPETEILSNIISFSETCKKSRGAITTDRYEWQDQELNDGLSLLESSIHYNFMTTYHVISSIKTSQMTVNVTRTSEGKMDGGSLVSAYNTIRTGLVGLLALDTARVYYLVDCAIDTQGVDYFRLSVSFFVAKSSSTPIPCGVQMNDHWRVADGLGKCDDSFQGLDASDREEVLLNLRYCYSNPCNVNEDYFPLWLTVFNLPYT